MGDDDAVRVLAFYLPQFHPTPENDAWWGPGFTEWTNVVRARPQFRGHDQPHLPADLGYYDLRVPEVREAQARLAREAGVHGFVYYHYWFSGRRLLHQPLDDVLASGRPDLPFALCWANESWTRTWDGRARDVLIGQEHSDDDDLAHLRWLAAVFDDPRYIRVDDKPLLLVYRASLLPDPARTTELWRVEARRLGVGELFLVMVASFPGDRGAPSDWGFDASVDWSPHWHALGSPLRRGWLARAARKLHLGESGYARHDVYDYDGVVAADLARPRQDDGQTRLPCVTPSFDNTPRRAVRGLVLQGATPAGYERWLRHAVDRARRLPAGRRLVFVNAWNEWAEGNHLEPDQRWGHAWLEATRRAQTEA